MKKKELIIAAEEVKETEFFTNIQKDMHLDVIINLYFHPLIKKYQEIEDFHKIKLSKCAFGDHNNPLNSSIKKLDENLRNFQKLSEEFKLIIIEESKKL